MRKLREATPQPQAYQMKVTLLGSRPPIWRRLLVRNDTTLDGLHLILQLAMGWTDSHMHQFLVAVKQTAERISTHPEAGAPLPGGFRKRIVPAWA